MNTFVFGDKMRAENQKNIDLRTAKIKISDANANANSEL